MSWSIQVFLAMLMVGAYLVGPICLIWGWIRWIRSPKQRTVWSILSLCSFLAATASAVLIVGLMIYSKVIGGFPYYDPRLMRMYRLGTLTSLIALLLALAGMARKSALRWFSVGSALGTLAVWFLAASNE